MAKALWRGYIALGYLGIPVRVLAMTQTSGVHFVQLHASDLSPVTRELRCSRDHQQVKYDDLVRGIEHEPGNYVTLTERELERSAPDAPKTLSVQQFCDVHAVPAVYYEKPYYVVPERGGEVAYALLREVFNRTGSMAIVSYMLYNKAHIGALSQDGDMLVLLQLRFTSELVPRSTIKTMPLVKPTPHEIELMMKVVEQYRSPVYMPDYHDESTERIQQLVERKIQGLPEPRAPKPAIHATPESQLATTLERTLQNGPKTLGKGLSL